MCIIEEKAEQKKGKGKGKRERGNQRNVDHTIAYQCCMVEEIRWLVISFPDSALEKGKGLVYYSFAGKGEEKEGDRENKNKHNLQILSDMRCCLYSSLRIQLLTLN